MTLRFSYVNEPLHGPPPPSSPSGTREKWRPLVPITIHGPSGLSLEFGRALLDTGSDDTLFSLDTAFYLNVPLLPDTGHIMRWGRQRFAMRFGAVELELVDDLGQTIRWQSTIGFASTAMPYPLLGIRGSLEYLDAKFLGEDRIVEIERNGLLQIVP